jgi:hypothetical protein
MTEDEWGNEWMDDAVPSGTEIAQVMLEIREEFGWQKMWSDCNGLRICPRVRVWLDAYQDRDYEEAFLLRVWTTTEDVERKLRVEVADHLAIYTNVSGSDSVEWRQEPRLFFDTDAEWGYKGMRWWVDWLETESESRAELVKWTPEERQRLSVSNEAIRQRHRENARLLGVNLPYFATEPK